MGKRVNHRQCLKPSVSYPDPHSTLGARIRQVRTLAEMVDSDVSEKEFSKLLEHAPWMMGFEYVGAKREFLSLGSRNRFDLFLRRRDGYYDLLELESIEARLFVGKDKHPSVVLTRAIEQVRRYLEDLDIRHLSFNYRASEIKTYYPVGTVLIGRSDPSEKELLMRLNSFHHRLKVITYTELLECAKSAVGMP
jgi:hypothetical protein